MTEADDRAAGRAPDAGSSGEPSDGFRQNEERFRLLVETVTDYAIFILDPGGYIRSWNPGAERLKGYRASEIIGKHFSIFYPRETLDSGLPAHELKVALEVGRFEDEGWRLRKDGSRFWANVVITRLRDRSGQHVGFAKITRDLTDRRAHEEALRESEERFRLMVESVRDYAIFMLDPAGYISSWNAGAERIKGYRPAEIIGKHFTVFYPPDAVARGLPQYELEVATREGRFEEEGWRLRKDGTRFWAHVVITALRDKAGELRGFAKITRDLTQRKHIERLEQEGRETTEFLAMLGHELRNPLAPIQNAVAIIRARTVNDPQVESARQAIDRQVNHLSRLVDDLLDMSRIASGKVTLHTEPVDFGALVARAVEPSRASLAERRQTLSLDLPPEPVRVIGDVTRLSQVVLNLLNNAAKYTPAGGQIWVSVQRNDGQAVLSVRDNGIGMTADLVPRVFDLFVQGARSLDRSEGGLGIGLTLVSRLVGSHGGSVKALSAGPGQGSEFLVRLPALDPAGVESGRPPESTGAASEGEGRRVLVVDDNADSAETMAMLLQIWGHDVHVAKDGPSALEAAIALRPEVVLLDIGLPGMTGYEVAQRLRDLPETSSAVLVAMTGYGQEEDRRTSREAGFAWHLVKPVRPDVLQKVFDDVRHESASSDEVGA